MAKDVKQNKEPTDVPAGAEAAAPDKAVIQDRKDNAIAPGVFLACAKGREDMPVEASDIEEATKLACSYFRCDPAGVVVTQCKRKAVPRRGDRVLRRGPVPGDPAAFGYEVGAKR